MVPQPVILARTTCDEYHSQTSNHEVSCIWIVKWALQSVALALTLALLASPAAALAMCAAMNQPGHCPEPAMHCPDCPDNDAAASLEQQPAPMDGSCCALSPARPSPRTDLQGPTLAPAGIPAVRTLVAATPALPTPPLPRRESVFLLPAESPQAVLCTFLI